MRKLVHADFIQWSCVVTAVSSENVQIHFWHVNILLFYFFIKDVNVYIRQGGFFWHNKRSKLSCINLRYSNLVTTGRGLRHNYMSKNLHIYCSCTKRLFYKYLINMKHCNALMFKWVVIFKQQLSQFCCVNMKRVKRGSGWWKV